jgi:hypothetical protein
MTKLLVFLEFRDPIRATVAASDIKLVTKPEKADIPTHNP